MKKDILTRVKIPDNIITPGIPDKDKALIFVPADKSYIQILDYKIEGFDSWESFLEHLKKYAEMEQEIQTLKNNIRNMHADKQEFENYLEIKLEESKLLSTYGGQGQFESIQERIYKEVLNRFIRRL